jgi:tetratricopeptide (TPR) repeat protein
MSFYGGDWVGTAAELESRAAGAQKAGARFIANGIRFFDAFLRQTMGDSAGAAASFEENLRTNQHDNDRMGWVWLSFCLAGALVDTGEMDRAMDLTLEARELMAGDEDWRAMVDRVDLVEARIAAGVGEMDRANAGFEHACAGLGEYRLAWEQAEGLRYWGQALLAAGERQGGLERLAAADDIYRRAGAGAPWLDRVEAVRAAFS